MSRHSSFKKEVIQEAIERLRRQVNAFQQEQKKKLNDVNIEDIDKGDVAESPKEQMMDEFLEQALPFEHLNKTIEDLQRVASTEVEDVVSLGSLVKTNLGYFLVGAAFREFSWKGNKITGLSTEAPLYKKMEGLKPDAEFHLHDREYIIQDIW
jgi:hypothetical protein